jgi:predicted GNAT superfamily acetyltransferase
VEPGEGIQTELKIQYRHCRTHEELRACQAIERAVWNDPILEVPFTLYVVVVETGGQMIGAFEGGRMLGFTFAVAGLRGKEPYIHSHMTAVLAEARNRGIGRGLKLFQRDDALARGIDRVEWTFDPLEIKNAYFNLMRLGAVVRRFLPNCYGITGSPLHAGLPTDRLVAEWDLRGERTERCLRNQAPVDTFSARAERIALPKSIGELKQNDPAAALQIQSRVREEFQQWLDRGYAAVALEINGDTAQYVLEPGDAA